MSNRTQNKKLSISEQNGTINFKNLQFGLFKTYFFLSNFPAPDNAYV